MRLSWSRPARRAETLRNYIYSFFNADNEKQRRETIHDKLEQLRVIFPEAGSGDSKVVAYTRCFLQCHYGHLPKDRLYRNAKARLKEEMQDSPTATGADYIYDLATKLTDRDSAMVFRSISGPSEDDALLNSLNKDVRSSNDRRNVFHFLYELKQYTVSRPYVE